MGFGGSEFMGEGMDLHRLHAGSLWVRRESFLGFSIHLDRFEKNKYR